MDDIIDSRRRSSSANDNNIIPASKRSKVDDKAPNKMEGNTYSDEEMMKIVATDGLALKHATKAQKKNRDIVLTAVKNNGNAIQYAQITMNTDVDIIRAAAQSNPSSLQFVGNGRADLNDCGCGANIDDWNIIRAAVELNGRLLRFASNRLKGDRDIVLHALKSDIGAMRFASEALRDDIEFVRAAIEVSSSDHWEKILKLSSERVKGDKTTVLLVLSRPNSNGFLRLIPHQYINKELLRDRDVAKQFLRTGELDELPEELRNDREVVLEAVSKDGLALEYASLTLQNDRQIVHKAVSDDGLALEYASLTLQNDREIVEAAVSNDGNALAYASPNLQNNRDIVEAAVNNNGYALAYASPNLKNDRDIVYEAIQEDFFALQYASENLRSDRHFIAMAVQIEGICLLFASEELKGDREIVILAVNNNGCTIQHASDELKNDYEIASMAVNEDGTALRFVSSSMRANKQIAMLALRQDNFACTYTAATLKEDPEFIAEAASFIVASRQNNPAAIGPKLQKRLLCINKALSVEDELPTCEEAIQDGVWKTFAEQKWRTPCYETIWLMGKCHDRGLPNDVKKSIAEYAGLGAQILLANELTALSFLYSKFAMAGCNWDKILYYRSLDHESDEES